MSDNVRGILAILLSGTAFVFNDALMKLISATLPAGQTLFLRGALATVFIIVAMVRLRQWLPLGMLAEPTIAARSLTTAVAAMFIVLSLQRWPLSTVNAVIQVAPLCVVAGAGLLFGERVGRGRWLAALAGFVGMLFVLKPIGAADGRWAVPEGRETALVIVVVALLLTVARDLLTRGIPKGVTPLFIAFASAAAAALGGLALLPFEHWIVPTRSIMGLVVASGLCTAVAYIFGIIAMRTGALSVVAPFRYFQVPTAVILGYLVWGHTPDALGFTGLGLILASGLYAVALERKAHRSAT